MNCDASGCSTYFTAFVTVRIPPNARQSAPPAAGTSYLNEVTADVTYADGTGAELEDSASVSTQAPVARVESVKQGPTTVAPGGAIQWQLYSKNSGNVTLRNAAIVDALPLDAAGNPAMAPLELYRPHPGYEPITPRGQVVHFAFSTDGSTWTDQYDWDSSVDTPATHAVPASAKYLKMWVDTLAPGAALDIRLRGQVPVETSTDDVLTNCLVFSADDLAAQAQKCVTTTVDELTTKITPYKEEKLSAAGQLSVVPGEVFLWKIGFQATGSKPIPTATLSDLLPKEFELVEVSCFTSYALGNGIAQGVIGGSCGKYPVPEYTAVVQPDDATLITFKDIELPDQATQNDLAYGIYLKVKVRPGAAIQTYTNEVKVSTNSAITTCSTAFHSAYRADDSTDIDGDGVTAEDVCVFPDTLPVVEAAAVELTKWDIGTLPNVFEGTGTATPPSDVSDTACPDWNGYTRYPCVAVTMPGDEFSYRLRLQNLGNVPLTDYVVYDILPVIGDTGVGKLLSSGQRGTKWSPELTGPVMLSGLSTTTNSGYQVEYNLTSNPCRPELNTNTADASWQGSCDDTWYTAATLPGGDWAAVRSFRITMFAADRTWASAGLLIFDVPMKAPLSAPQSQADPLDLSVAWNSVAQRIYRTSVTGKQWMKPSEPRKVGIIVPFTLIKVSVGDYVWYDENSDGVQDRDEAPAKDVKVILYDADGVKIAETTTNADGYYWFVNLEPETKYSLEFIKPDGYVWTTPDAGADDAKDSDVDAAGRVSFTSPKYEVGGTNNQPGAPDKTDDPTLDAGLVTYVPLVSIGDHVWLDVNRNGLQDDDHPLADVTVRLYAVDPESGERTVLTSTTTDADGFYSFVDLLPSTTYDLEFVKPGETHAFTTTGVGDDRAVDSNPDASGWATVTTPGAGANSSTTPDDPTIDAGLVQLNLLISKELVSTGPFYAGATVVFTVTPANDGLVDALPGWSVVEVPQAGLTITGMDGGADYSCTVATLTCVSSKPLAAGALGAPITVTAVIAADAVGTLRNVAYVVPATGEVSETNPLVVPKDALVDTGSTDTDNDAQAEVKVASLVSVGDYVWWDHNRDGLQDATEPPVAGVTVNLLDADGAVLKSTVTDANGYYFFADLLPGASYAIEFVKPVGASFTVMGGSADAAVDAKDSDADVVTGRVSFVAPAAGSNLTEPGKADNPTLDAGLVSFNLTLDKQLVTAEVIRSGGEVTFALTPRNAGPSAALGGWTITDLVPANTTLVSVSGEGYSCQDAQCTVTTALAPGASGPVLTVVVKVVPGFSGTLKNVAYVSPSPQDVPETNPLVVPGVDTDTAASPTDNDAQAPFEVLPGPVDDITDVDGDSDDGDVLAFTGTAGMLPLLFVGLLAMAAGVGLRLRSRRVAVQVRRR